MYYASNAYISAKTWTSALMKAYLWSINDRKLAENLIGVKDTGKVANQKVAKLRTVLILLLVKIFALVELRRDSRFHSINITNELYILNCQQRLFNRKKWTEKHISLYTHEYKRKGYGLPFLRHKPLHHTEGSIASFHTALFKSHNYGIICNTHFIPR